MSKSNMGSPKMLGPAWVSDWPEDLHRTECESCGSPAKHGLEWGGTVKMVVRLSDWNENRKVMDNTVRMIFNAMFAGFRAGKGYGEMVLLVEDEAGNKLQELHRDTY